MKEINERVLKLMRDLGLDTSDEVLVVKITIIYLEAQRDQLKADREELDAND
jgi:hypothetical protein